MSSRPNQLQVLIVEDSEADATLLEHELMRAGFAPVCHRVETHSEMAAALARQSWDLIIADYVLPRFDGLSALELVREHGLDLPFIVVSGVISDHTAVEAMKAGAHDYLMKDNLVRLGSAVQRELLEAQIRMDRRQAEDRLRAEHAITRLLAVASDINEAAPRIMLILRETLDLDFGILWWLGPNQRVLRSKAVSSRPDLEFLEGFALKRPAHTWREGQGLPGMVWRELLPVCAEAASLSTSPATEAPKLLKTALAFPIQSAASVFGVLEFWTRRSLRSNPALLSMLTAIGSEVGQFIQRRNAETALREAHAELEIRVQQRTAELETSNANLQASIAERRRLEHELLEITENERRRIGLDLHDDLGQKLSGIALMTKGMELRLAKTNAAEAREAGKIRGLVQEVMNHASDLAHDLATLDFANNDLAGAGERLAARATELFGIPCRFKALGQLPPLEAASVSQVCKIAQEAITNAIKHGKAKRVEIRLATRRAGLVLTVKNNGAPFPDLQGSWTGMGLRIMNYRARLLGGTLEIKGLASKGTLLTCVIPLETNQAKI